MTWRSVEELGEQGDINRRNRHLKEWLQKRSGLDQEVGVHNSQTKASFPVGIHGNRQIAWTNSSKSLTEVRLTNEERLRLEGYQRHAFNQLLSDKIGLRRNVPDTRDELCKDVSYPADLPSASIIICFHNEASSALLRTVQSVLDRSPLHLIKEIILVDDNSDQQEDSKKIKEFVSSHAKVWIKRTEKREGLIRGRTIGARSASGDILVFLDSHCEVNTQWLEPLLTRVKERSNFVVCPIIDIINSDSFMYKPSGIVRGGFNWGLHFKWEQVPNTQRQTPADIIKPIKSPTMAGGLFAINRTYFQQIGEYDQGMEIWGGENLELSFRLWMCGGGLEIIPCSRVGHVFRKRRPYDDPYTFNSVYRNQIRLAEVWLDNYKVFFYRSQMAYNRLNPGDITSRLNLKKQLKCKSFGWYLKNIYPELQVPGPVDTQKSNPAVKSRKAQRTFDNDQILKVGQIRSEKMDGCLDINGNINMKRAGVVVNPCRETEDQIWAYSLNNELRMGLLCLDVVNNAVIMMKCSRKGQGQDWEYRNEMQSFYNKMSDQCLGWDESLRRIVLVNCNERPKWSWKEV